MIHLKIQPYEAIKIGSEPFSENNNFWSGRPVLPGILNQVQPTSTSIATSGNFVPPLPSQMSNSITQSLSNYASAHSSSTRCPRENSLLPSDLRVQKSKEIEKRKSSIAGIPLVVQQIVSIFGYICKRC